MLPFPAPATPPMPLSMVPPEPLPEPVMIEPVPPPPGPKPEFRPIWYDPITHPSARKPKLATARAVAQQDQEDFSGYVEIAAESMQRLAVETFGHFVNDEERIRSGKIETFRSNALAQDHRLMVTELSSMEVLPLARFRDEIDKEEGRTKEDAVAYFIECWDRQHARSGWGRLKPSLVSGAGSHGRLAANIMIDVTDDECGLAFRMLDPATTFPTFEGKRGLGRVTCVYSAPLSDVVGWFNLTPAKEKKLRKSTGAGEDDHDPVGEVIEYYNREWHGVWFNDEEVKLLRHGYGFVPVVYQRSPWGPVPGFARAPSRWPSHDGSDVGPPTYGLTGGGVGDFFDRTESERRMGLPYLWDRWRQHDQIEAIYGRDLTEFKKLYAPPMVLIQDLMATRGGVPERDDGEAGIMTITTGEAPVAIPPPAPGAAFAVQALHTQVMQEAMLASPGAAARGINPAAQTSGSAIQGLQERGLAPFKSCAEFIEGFLTEVMEMALTLYRDWGEILGVHGDRGRFLIPRRNPRTGEATAHDLTPELIEKVGTRIEITLKEFDPDSLVMRVVGLIQAKSAGWIDDRRAIEMLGFTSDPDGVLLAVKRDRLNEVPEVQQMDMLDVLMHDVELAYQREDPDSMDVAMTRYKYLAEQMMVQQQMKMAMQAKMSGPSKDERLLDRLAGTPPPQMMMLPEPAGGPGMQGGAPAGPQGPQGAMPSAGSVGPVG